MGFENLGKLKKSGRSAWIGLLSASLLLIPLSAAFADPPPPGAPVNFRWLDGNDSQMHCYEFDPNGNELNNNMPVDNSNCS